MIVRGVLVAGAGIGSLIAQASFSSTIGLGSLIVGMLVVILFGVFSLRDRRNAARLEAAAGWKDLYEQEREKNNNLIEEKEIERVERHAVKDELATAKALLLVEQAKPNMSEILEQQRILWTNATADLTAVLQTMQDTQKQMLAILTESKGG